ALRTSNTVLCGYVGSGIGNTVRSVGRTTRSGAAPWAATGAAVSGPSTSMRAMRASVIDVLIPCSCPVALFSLAPEAPSIGHWSHPPGSLMPRSGLAQSRRRFTLLPEKRMGVSQRSARNVNECLERGSQLQDEEDRV